VGTKVVKVKIVIHDYIAKWY